jgi:hypothetical protein
MSVVVTFKPRESAHAKDTFLSLIPILPVRSCQLHGRGIRTTTACNTAEENIGTHNFRVNHHAPGYPTRCALLETKEIQLGKFRNDFNVSKRIAPLFGPHTSSSSTTQATDANRTDKHVRSNTPLASLFPIRQAPVPLTLLSLVGPGF